MKRLKNALMHTSHNKHYFLRSGAALFIAVCICVLTQMSVSVDAATVDDIKKKISANNQKIEEIQKQIDQYSTLLNSTSKEANTLKNALKTLEITQKKLEANLKLTSTQISKTTLTLGDLATDIADAEKKVIALSAAVSRNIRDMDSAESQSGIENLLVNRSISDAFDYINALKTVQGLMKRNLEDVHDTRMFLGAKKDQVLGEKTRLESYRKNLTAQSKVIEINKSEKDQLLKDTQNKESTYKTILAQKVTEREVFEKELFDYESQLKITVDPSAIPGARSGILSWPLEKIVVTQYFGKTVSAQRLYTSGSHGGMDFKASLGTKVMTALSGTVLDSESVRVKQGCQYGKWVLIRHANGLTSIYGHLSYVSVKAGDTVITGDTIGYSGSTGYSTGPHLHFGIYASGGVRVVDASSIGSSRCKGIKTVAANPTAYLDPSAYLPKL